jgi:F-type H+-transporting ATPase subunit a
MSGSMIVAILLSITPLIFPIFMTLLGLLTGMVQAYIFSILATVYIAASTQTQRERTGTPTSPGTSEYAK